MAYRGDGCQTRQAFRQTAPVAGITEQGQALGEQLRRPRRVLLVEGDVSQIMQETGHGTSCLEHPTARQPLVIEVAGALILTLMARHVAEGIEHLGQDEGLLHPAYDRQALLESGSGRLQVAAHERDPPQPHQRYRRSPGIARLAIRRQTLLVR